MRAFIRDSHVYFSLKTTNYKFYENYAIELQICLKNRRIKLLKSALFLIHNNSDNTSNDKRVVSLFTYSKIRSNQSNLFLKTCMCSLLLKTLSHEETRNPFVGGAMTWLLQAFAIGPIIQI